LIERVLHSMELILQDSLRMWVSNNKDDDDHDLSTRPLAI
jgi:hypothetical protein